MEESKKNNLRWWILLTVIVGTFLGRIDQTIVGLALPKIIDDFSISVTAAGWISTAYILANAIFVPIWGKLGDMIGQKKVYIMGFSIFIVGSVLAGLAWNLSSMIIFRVIQAVASSADYPTAMAILAITFKSAKERAQALGIWSASFGAAAVFGPLIGGPLIDNFGWRSIFMVNIPIGVIGLLMAMSFIQETEHAEKRLKFDWWGALSLGGSLTSLVLVLDKGLDWGWISWQSSICYLITIFFAALFVQIEKKVQSPVVDLDFFKNKIFVNVLGNNFIVFMSMMGAIFLIPIFAQSYLGYDATQTGYLFIPMAGAMLLAAPLGARLVGKIRSNYIIMASTGTAALGLYLFSYIDARSTAINIIFPMIVMAFGMGFGMAQRTTIITYTVPADNVGSASSVLALARNISGAFGIALFGTILQNSIYSNAIEVSRFSSIHLKTPELMAKFTGLIIFKAQIMAYDRVFLISSIVMFIGALMAYWIKVAARAGKTEEIFVE
jgi:EmrB/QacA subfamily drug resistance transporter